jgi:hypothetical protein
VDRESDAEIAATTARGRSAKKGVVAFDYSKVLDLPMDILSRYITSARLRKRLKYVYQA